ncbi:hypothetical protein QBC34DRAFT_406129 [Podospora aff. communis PSN243]|uniref:Nephrocystin 3-like N-terminal domain-containing protein n=1 Tax=Podospora aff. communis PSN243 TaxID=3040156 RepID=A0AAV9GKU0_9PEZI|nr:hypothetical protein QBC34DRAFT_406129 [Podospora aff. communis PSN243]
MDEADGKYYRGPVPQTGMTVLFEPPEPTLDVVFVHGFTGHPERTWTCAKGGTEHAANDRLQGEGSEPPHKARKLNAFSRAFSSQWGIKPHVYWPRDLLPLSLPQARVLTFGYDSRVRHRFASSVDKGTVCDFAWDLLLALERCRRETSPRPLLFVAHSFGGIVVKEMLRRSKSCQLGQAYLQCVFNTTTGVMFFGTPHAGADPRTFLDRIVEKVFRAAQFTVEEQIIQSLLPTSERLKELRDVFGPMAQERNWTIHSFQEQFGVGILDSGKVVEDTSSCLGLSSVETTQYIRRNHIEMCRFTGVDDPEYIKVVDALRRMASSTCYGEQSLTNDQRERLMDSLRFDQIDARQMTIKNAHTNTCKWLLDTHQYVQWLDPGKSRQHGGFLWIKGKAGTGKSTLMKFALSNSQNEMSEELVTSFFFNARGGDLERSTLGMYRSLLFQILEQDPNLQDVLAELTPLRNAFARKIPIKWNVETLQEVFEVVVKNLNQKPLVCFVDALDECDEYEIRDMMSFFERMGCSMDRTAFRVCFASRHYPQITICKALHLVLEGQVGHDGDIVHYLSSELKIGESKLAKSIRLEVQEKATGVFMWVVLVTRILNREYDSGNIHSLRKMLKSIPKDLHALFREILTHDDYNRDQQLLCILWILYARQPLTPKQLYFAVFSDFQPCPVYEWDQDEINEAAMVKFVISSSKGLAEVTRSSVPTVQFIHESVRDFLTKHNGLRNVWLDLTDNLEGEAHERLKQCCLKTIKHVVAGHRFHDLRQVSSPFKRRIATLDEETPECRISVVFPFLSYAIAHVFSHADLAEETGVDQTEFLQNFCISEWIRLENELRACSQWSWGHTEDASLLYVLGELDVANLIRRHPSRADCFRQEKERYAVPYLAALAAKSSGSFPDFFKTNLLAKSSSAARVFLETQLQAVELPGLTRMLCERFLEQWGSETDSAGFFNLVNADDCVSINLAWHAPEPAVLLYYHRKEFTVDMEAFDSDGQRHLSAAIHRGHESVARLLLERGVSVQGTNEASGSLRVDPLLEASRRGLSGLVSLFIEYGANVSATPLVWAVHAGHEEVVKILLDAGAKFPPEASFVPELMRVVGDDQRVISIAKLLLEHGANLEATNGVDQTALLAAVVRNNLTLVQFLLDEGANIEGIEAHVGQTPLLAALSRNYLSVASLLVERGAKVDVVADHLMRDAGLQLPTTVIPCTE